MTKKRLVSIVFGGLFSLFVPLGAFYFLKWKGHDGHITLPPAYGLERIDTQKIDGKLQFDSVFHQVADIGGVNQLGDSVYLNQNLANKIIVINFFFTSCTTICPELMKNMQLLNRAFKKNDSSLRLISLSVDPKTDSVTRLRQYADRLKVNHDKWFFIQADKKQVYNYARNELFLKLNPGDGGDDDFIHPEKIVLLDKYRNIRGYYNGLDAEEVRHCAEDITFLMLEKNKRHEKQKNYGR